MSECLRFNAMSATRAIFMDKMREIFMFCRGGFENGR